MFNSKKARERASLIAQHLIPWEESLECELAAREVLCITPNLEWVHVNRERIFERLRSNRDKVHKYIVFDNQVDGFAEKALKHADELISGAASDKNIKARNSFQILFLTRRNVKPCLWSASGSHFPSTRSQDWERLPIPSDMVLYVDTTSGSSGRLVATRSAPTTTFAAISLTPVRPVAYASISSFLRKLGSRAKFKAPEPGWDIVLRQRKHYNPIWNWFLQEWDGRIAS